MNPWMRRAVRLLVVGAIVVAGLWGGRTDLWSSNAKPMTSSSGSGASAQAASPEAESLQAAFIRIAQQLGPSVVSISTEQIERVKQYFRIHPFFGDEPFEEFFRQFYGDAPEREFRRFGLGSGVIIDEQGYVLTNEHVVANSDKITVTLADGREFTGTVKGKDPRSDLSVIKVDAKQLPVAPLGNSEALQVGQWVVTLGNPLGLASAGPSTHVFGAEPTLSVGVISGLRRQLPRMSRYDRDYSDLIQTDATINPGNSGGPLVSLQGEVIGINVAIITGPGNAYGFAIPVNKAKGVLGALIEGKKVVYGWLGIQIQDITDDVAEYYGLAEREGVLVYQVLPESPASRAGLQDGDIIKSFDGQPIRHSRELIDQVSRTAVGRRAAVDILREKKRQTLQVEIGERPLDAELASSGSAESWRGLKVSAINPDLFQQFNLPSGTTGVLVTEVEPDSPAEQAGLRPGDVINEINRIRVEDLNGYQRATAQVKGNALVRTSRGYVVIKETAE
jgi:serine protease Do